MKRPSHCRKKAHSAQLFSINRKRPTRSDLLSSIGFSLSRKNRVSGWKGKTNLIPALPKGEKSISFVPRKVDFPLLHSIPLSANPYRASSHYRVQICALRPICIRFSYSGARGKDRARAVTTYEMNEALIHSPSSREPQKADRKIGGN